MREDEGEAGGGFSPGKAPSRTHPKSVKRGKARGGDAMEKPEYR